MGTCSCPAHLPTEGPCPNGSFCQFLSIETAYPFLGEELCLNMLVNFSRPCNQITSLVKQCLALSCLVPQCLFVFRYSSRSTEVDCRRRINPIGFIRNCIMREYYFQQVLTETAAETAVETDALHLGGAESAVTASLPPPLRRRTSST